MKCVPKHNVQGKGPFSKKALASGYNQAGDIVTKRITYSTTATFAALGSVTGISSQNAKASGVEWSSFAARYQAFRVKSMRLSFIANCPVQEINGSSINHGVLFCGDTLVSNAPGSIQQILSDERSVVHPTWKCFTFTASWLRNPNARLWNTVTSAIPAANQYQIVFGSPDTYTASTSVQCYDIIVEYDVEFRGSQ